MKAFFVEANIVFFKKKKHESLKFSRQHVDRVFSSMMRTVIDSQLIRKNLSISLLFRREKLLLEPLLVGVEFLLFVCERAFHSGFVKLQCFDDLFLKIIKTLFRLHQAGRARRPK